MNLYSFHEITIVGQFELEGLRKDFNKINKEVARLRIVSDSFSFLSVNFMIIFFSNLGYFLFCASLNRMASSKY